MSVDEALDAGFTTLHSKDEGHMTPHGHHSVYVCSRCYGRRIGIVGNPVTAANTEAYDRGHIGERPNRRPEEFFLYDPDEDAGDQYIEAYTQGWLDKLVCLVDRDDFLIDDDKADYKTANAKAYDTGYGGKTPKRPEDFLHNPDAGNLYIEAYTKGWSDKLESLYVGSESSLDGDEVDGYMVEQPTNPSDWADDPEGGRDYFREYMNGYRRRLRECIQIHKKSGLIVTEALTVSPGDDGYYCRRPVWPGKMTHDPEGAREYAKRYAKGYRDRLRECIRDHKRFGA